MRTIILTALLLLTTSCIGTSLVKYPTFDEAMSIPGSQTPLIGQGEEFDMSEMPLLIQYASIHARGDGGFSPGELARAVAAEARKQRLRPDVILMGASEVRNTGMVHYGYGVFGNTVATEAWGWLYRVSPTCLGINLNKMNMIISIKEASDARKAGLQEGDTLVSINGAEVDHGPKSKYSQMLLGLTVGEEVDVIWVRPGTGRLEGRLKMIASSRDKLNKLADERDSAEAARTREERLWEENDF